MSGPATQVDGPVAVVVAGPVRHPLVAGSTIRIGRDPGCDIVVNSPPASRRHVQIGADRSGAVTIRGLGSANGSFVDGRRLDEFVVGDGAVLTLGAPDGPALTVTRTAGALRGPRSPRWPPRRRAGATGAGHTGETVLVVAERAVQGRTITIGRAPSNAIVLDDPLVSRHHARLTGGPRQGYRIEDLSGLNGVRINGRPAPGGSVFRDGDRLGIGPHHAGHQRGSHRRHRARPHRAQRRRAELRHQGPRAAQDPARPGELPGPVGIARGRHRPVRRRRVDAAARHHRLPTGHEWPRRLPRHRALRELRQPAPAHRRRPPGRCRAPSAHRPQGPALRGAAAPAGRLRRAGPRARGRPRHRRPRADRERRHAHQPYLGRPAQMRLGGPRTAHPARAAAARRAHLGARPGHGQVRHGAAAHPDRRRARGARRHPQHRQPRPVRRGAHPGARRPGRLPRPATPGCSATAGVLGYFGAERYAEVFQSLSDTPDRHAERYRRLHPGAPAQPPPDARHRPAPAAAARPTRGIPQGWGPRLGPA